MKEEALIKFIKEGKEILAQASPLQKERYYQLLLRAKRAIEESKKPRILAEHRDYIDED